MQSLVVMMVLSFLAPTGANVADLAAGGGPSVYFLGDNGALQEAGADDAVARAMGTGVLQVADCAMVIAATAREDDTLDGPGVYTFENALVIQAGVRPGKTFYHTNDYGIVVARTDGDRGDVYVANEGSLAPTHVYEVAEDGSLVASGSDGAGRFYLDELGLVASAE
jgi:hypothetical protein